MEKGKSLSNCSAFSNQAITLFTHWSGITESFLTGTLAYHMMSSCSAFLDTTPSLMEGLAHQIFWYGDIFEAGPCSLITFM